jgi:flagellar protein FliL
MILPESLLMVCSLLITWLNKIQLMEMSMAAQEKTKKEMMEDEEENENEQQTPPEKKGSKLKLIIIIVVVLLLLAGGGAAAYFLLFKNKMVTGEKKSAGQEKTQVIVMWPMDPYIVNLIDNEGERYLKVVLQLELSDQKMTEEMKLLNPKLRDAILELLSSKSYKEMIDPLGKARLRDEITMRVNMNIDGAKGKVLKVYFTEFVIQ